MKRRLLLAAAALTLFVGAAPNWSATVTQGPNGAYVLGNPRAKVRLVEYLSFTCSHCAHFVTETSEPLKRDYVSKGNVAVEMRNAVRDPFDMTAAMLARCGGAARFFGNTEAIMARQDVWMAEAQLLLARDGARMQKLAPAERLKLIAYNTDLGAVMKTRGFTKPQLDACLTSVPTQRVVIGMTNEAFNVRKIAYTPYFLINGKPGPSTDKWPDMEVALRAALGGK